MESIARLGLFFLTYFTLLCLTNILSVELQLFQFFIFMLSSLIMGGWLYYLHFIKKSSPEFLRETLYVMIFLCLITAIWSISYYSFSDV